LAAALVLGCEGVWAESLWLKTAQSEVTPEIKAKMFEAEASDAILTTTVTGKPCRTLNNASPAPTKRPALRKRCPRRRRITCGGRKAARALSAFARRIS